MIECTDREKLVAATFFLMNITPIGLILHDRIDELTEEEKRDVIKKAIFKLADSVFSNLSDFKKYMDEVSLFMMKLSEGTIKAQTDYELDNILKGKK